MSASFLYVYQVEKCCKHSDMQKKELQVLVLIKCGRWWTDAGLPLVSSYYYLDKNSLSVSMARIFAWMSTKWRRCCEKQFPHRDKKVEVQSKTRTMATMSHFYGNITLHSFVIGVTSLQQISVPALKYNCHIIYVLVSSISIIKLQFIVFDFDSSDCYPSTFVIF